MMGIASFLFFMYYRIWLLLLLNENLYLFYTFGLEFIQRDCQFYTFSREFVQLHYKFYTFNHEFI